MRKMVFIPVFIVILSYSLLFSGAAVSAEDITNTPGIINTDKADALKEIGLFSGTDKGYELDRAPTRVEGAIMLLRLMGKEQEATNSNYECPFSDVPKWAARQIGYMYEKGLTNGVSEKDYGASQNITASQYVTFVLRALGYNDSAGDFNWKTAIDKAAEIGLLSKGGANALKQKAVFLRDDAVGISYSALTTSVKRSDMTLIEKLVLGDKIVSAEAAEKAGVWNKDQSNTADGSQDTKDSSGSSGSSGSPGSSSSSGSSGSSGSSDSSGSFDYKTPCDFGKEYLAQNGLAYTMTNVVESINGKNYSLELQFHIRNTVYPEAPQEQNFKIYHSDGSTKYQSFPFEKVSATWISRRIQIDIYDGRRVVSIELGPDPSSIGPEKDTLKWDISTVVRQAAAKSE